MSDDGISKVATAEVVDAEPPLLFPSVPKNSMVNFLTTDVSRLWQTASRETALLLLAWSSVVLAAIQNIRGRGIKVTRRVPTDVPRRWLGVTRAYCIYTSKPMGWSSRWTWGPWSWTLNFGRMATLGARVRDVVEVVYEHKVDDGEGGSPQYFISSLPWFSILLLPPGFTEATVRQRPRPAIFASFDTAPEVDVSALLNERIWSFYDGGVPYAAVKAILLNKNHVWHNPRLTVTLGDLTELSFVEGDQVAW